MFVLVSFDFVFACIFVVTANVSQNVYVYIRTNVLTEGKIDDVVDDASWSDKTRLFLYLPSVEGLLEVFSRWCSTRPNASAAKGKKYFFIHQFRGNGD